MCIDVHASMYIHLYVYIILFMYVYVCLLVSWDPFLHVGSARGTWKNSLLVGLVSLGFVKVQVGVSFPHKVVACSLIVS